MLGMSGLRDVYQGKLEGSQTNREGMYTAGSRAGDVGPGEFHHMLQIQCLQHSFSVALVQSILAEHSFSLLE